MDSSMRGAAKRLQALEQRRAARASGVVAVIDAIGKEPEQVAAELARLERLLPAGQVVIVVDI
jgi:cephalosporin hydroxylase